MEFKVTKPDENNNQILAKPKSAIIFNFKLTIKKKKNLCLKRIRQLPK